MGFKHEEKIQKYTNCSGYGNLSLCSGMSEISLFTNFSKTKFASSDLYFENPDQEFGLPDSRENELKVFGPSVLSILFLSIPVGISNQVLRSGIRISAFGQW